MIFRTLDDSTLVSGQIGVAEIAEAAAMGVTTIVNNRPDGEEPGQPAGAAIQAAARAAGLAYRHLPIAGGIAPAQIEALSSILDEGGGRLLLFCRSGTRSTYLWALAQSRRGVDGKTIAAQASAAGYDLGPLLPSIG